MKKIYTLFFIAILCCVYNTTTEAATVLFENKSNASLKALPIPQVSTPKILAVTPPRSLQIKISMPEDSKGMLIADDEMTKKIINKILYPPFRSAYDKKKQAALYDKAWKAYLRFARENVNAWVKGKQYFKVPRLAAPGKTGDNPTSYASWSVAKSLTPSGKDEYASWYDVLAQYYEKGGIMPPTKNAYASPKYNQWFGLVNPSKKWGAFESKLPPVASSFKIIAPMLIKY